VAAYLTMTKKLKNKSDTLSSPQMLAQVERLARLIRSASHADGLHPAQWDVLRYLARANSFSNSPRAMARYFGATKGTVSQTVSTLIKKGHLIKATRSNDTRSISLALTPQGRAVLQRDPLERLEKSISALGEKTKKRFSKGVAELLIAETLAQDEPSFGTCLSCRFYRERGKSESDLCMKFTVGLLPDHLNLLCVEHVLAG
jgi:DNA-binding MarR family transcriptional regulator